MSKQQDYDLFISYAQRDEEWVKCVLIPETGLGEDRILTQANFKLGNNTISEFERAITKSRYTLLILSPAFLNDKWTNFSEVIVSFSRVKLQRNCLIPIFLEPCTIPLHIEFIQSLNCIDKSDYDQEFSRLRQLLEQPEPKLEQIPCPYPGMKPFDKKDARFFYGREDEINELKSRLRNQNYLFVIGTSGSGKSSLIEAGLVPRLEEKQPLHWLIKSFRPGQTTDETPIQKLAKELQVTDLKDVSTREQYSKLVNALLAQKSSEAELLLIIDQFEELFSHSINTEQRRAFINAIKMLRQVERIRLILAMRADFYPDLMNSELWPLEKFERVEITPLQGDRLREAIINPAADCGVYIETILIERLLNDAAADRERGVLPLLQETMVLLWEKMEHHILTLDAYEKLGKDANKSGLAVAIARHADGTIQKLSQGQQNIARRIFIRLVQFGKGRANTRRQQMKKDLQNVTDNIQEFEYSLEHLVKNRLLTPTSSKNGKDEETKIDIAHERLIESWPTLQQWLKEFQEAEEILRQLIVKVDDWEKSNRKGGLLDQYELANADKCLNRDDVKKLGYSQNLSNLSKFIETSRKAINDDIENTKKTNKKLRNLLNISIFFGILSFLAAIGAGFGFWQATQQQRIATSRQRAAESLSNLDKDYELALLSSVEAFQTGNTFEARDALVKTLQYAPQLRTFLHGHQAEILTLGFTEDEQQLISGDRQGLISLWDTGERRLKQFNVKNSKENIASMTLSSDGQLLALGICPNNTDNSQEMKFYQGCTGWSIVDSKSTEIRLWDVVNRQPIKIIWDSSVKPWDIHLPMTLLKFSPSNKLLAFGTPMGDGEGFNVLDISDQSSDQIIGKLLSKVETYGGPYLERQSGEIMGGTRGGIWSITFSGNSEILAVAGRRAGFMNDPMMASSPLAFWNILSQKFDSGFFDAHFSTITSLAFMPNDQVLASGSLTNNIILWNLENIKQPVLSQPLTGHNAPITHLVFSPDQQILASGSADQSIILWNLDIVINSATRKEPEGYDHPSWDRQTRLPIKLIRNNPLKVHKDSISSLAFPKNNSQILASASKDGTIILWNIAKSEFIGQPLTGYRKLNFSWGSIEQIGFNQKGTIIAFKTENEAFLVWDLQTNEPISDFPMKDIVWNSYFASDSNDEQPSKKASSPHNDLLAMITNEGIVIKDKQTDKALGQPLYNTPSFKHIVFTPNGKILVAVDDDGVMLFHIDLELWKANACGKVSPNFSDLEKEQICKTISTNDPILARELLISAEAQALEGNMDTALIKLKKALQLDPSFQFNPEEKAKQIAAMGLIYQGKEFVQKGEVEKAITAYADAQKLFPNLNISAEYWNSLCWFGSLYEAADQVINACEQLIEIEPNNGSYRNSRGLARALTGDINGAIEDFNFYIKWSEKNDVYEWEREKRKIWISKLQSGKMPCDSETLKGLR